MVQGDADGNIVNRDHYLTDVSNSYKETIKELQHRIDSINEVRAKETIYYQGKLQEKNETEVTKYNNKFKIYGICLIGLGSSPLSSGLQGNY